MSKTVKAMLAGAVIVVLIIGILLTVVVMNIDGIVKAGVERTGTRTLGTDVSLADAKISLRRGSGVLTGLRIANPEGFSAGSAFELDEILLDLEIASLGSDEIVIDRILVDGARVRLEEQGGRFNLRELVPDRDPDPDADADLPRLVIREFRFTNGSAEVRSERLEAEATVPIPDLVLRDIGRRGAGVTAAEAGAQLIRPLVQQVIEGAQGAAIGEIRERATEQIRNLLRGRRNGQEAESAE